MFFIHAVLAFSLSASLLQAEHIEPPNFLLTPFLETEEFASLEVVILFIPWSNAPQDEQFSLEVFLIRF